MLDHIDFRKRISIDLKFVVDKELEEEIGIYFGKNTKCTTEGVLMESGGQILSSGGHEWSDVNAKAQRGGERLFNRRPNTIVKQYRR